MRGADDGGSAGPRNTTRGNLAGYHVGAPGVLIEVPQPDAPYPLRVVGNRFKGSRVFEGPIGREYRLAEHAREVFEQALHLPRVELTRRRLEA